ncbi:MAG TPA: N-acetylmuramic acid 6-phosphate etherase [Anaeromyxobacteraceae bacterium]|nr:N-acetylmuramic acid 6-phosphate etherase [Anaeromyxobacteraceae bacterium]
MSRGARPRLPVTEALDPRGRRLGEGLSPGRTLAILHTGHRDAVRAVGRALPALARLAEAAARSLAEGGRIVYVGAGTSGRLAALDAAECPPTFGVSPARVVAVVAGGARALRRAVEGAEDDAAAGAVALRRLRPGRRDLVLGISASGTTPFVLAALGEARRAGARTGLLTSNPRARPPVHCRAVLATGPEMVAGSTRLKAGAAAKMALGLLSTAAFARLGAVRRGRLSALSATSAKLRRRAVGTVAELGGVTPARARRALQRAGWRVADALAALPPAH